MIGLGCTDPQTSLCWGLSGAAGTGNSSSRARPVSTTRERFRRRAAAGRRKGRAHREGGLRAQGLGREIVRGRARPSRIVAGGRRRRRAGSAVVVAEGQHQTPLPGLSCSSTRLQKVIEFEAVTADIGEGVEGLPVGRFAAQPPASRAGVSQQAGSLAELGRAISADTGCSGPSRAARARTGAKARPVRLGWCSGSAGHWPRPPPQPSTGEIAQAASPVIASLGKGHSPQTRVLEGRVATAARSW